MRVYRIILSTILMSLLTFASISIFGMPSFQASAQGTGSLTGVIYDSGVDMDSDGKSDYLVVGVEVNVSTAGIFYVEISGLYDSTDNYINVSNETRSDLDVDIQAVYILLDGPTIYASGFNPVRVSSISLYDEYHMWLGYVYDVSLSREYAYTEFDLPPAFLTGTIYDIGVDADGDGLFDYLEVGVQVNVTDAGNYTVYIWDLLDSGHNYIWFSSYGYEYLDAGIQVANVSLRGPKIYLSGLNPVSISQISLYSGEYPWHVWLDSVHDVPLSREYLYTEFDSPFNDMEAIFVVYPDGRVVMRGVLNYTDMEPPNPYLSMHGGASVKKSDTATDVSASFTIIVPPEEVSEFPFNSSDFTLLSEYSSDLLTTTISGSTVLPLSVASEFPFNITDFTVIGTYMGNLINGNITVDIWNGFPLDDIVIDFQGNQTYVHLNGSTTVIFGNYPDFGELNATVLEQLLADLTNTIGGQGPNSLYNMTNGLLEFTMLSNITTPHNGYATVDFEAKLEGDLIRTLVNMTGQPVYLYDVLNTTWSSVESGSIVMTYTHTFRQADMNLDFVANVTSLIDNMIPILPDIAPAEELQAFIEGMLNTTYCIVDSAQVSMNYDDGEATITATATIHDLNAELNYIKDLYLTYVAEYQPWTQQLQTFNETQVDLTNLSMSLNLTETSMEVTVSGFAVLAPLDWINATNFRLEGFFNSTASEYEPPGNRERLRVAVEGGSNATHTVTIFRPGTVPEPDMSAPSGMIWSNQSVSSLKDLIFQIGPLDDTLPDIDTPVQVPEVPDDGEAVTVSVNVTDADSGVRPDGVILSYRIDGGAWNNITMSKTAGDTYEGIIPGLPAGTQVEYMITARDYANNEAVEDDAGQYYIFTVIGEFPTWQILALTLLLTGIILVIIRRRRQNDTRITSPQTSNSLSFLQ